MMIFEHWSWAERQDKMLDEARVLVHVFDTNDMCMTCLRHVYDMYTTCDMYVKGRGRGPRPSSRPKREGCIKFAHQV